MDNTRLVILEAKDVKVVFNTYDKESIGIDHFSLKIHEGEILGLVGESGSGKSVASLVLLGLVQSPGVIANGEVFFMGEDLLKKPESELQSIRGREISLILQSPHAALNPMLTVGDQLINVYKAHENRASKQTALQHSIDMLRLVGINDPERRVKAFPHELSGGMAQRVVIAAALSLKPKLLIADELSSGLDVTVQAQILDDMWESVQQTGSAILIISKDLGVVANYCDRVVVMNNGMIVEDAPVHNFFHSPQHIYSQNILRIQREAKMVEEKVVEKQGLGYGQARDENDHIIVVKNLNKVFPIQGSKEKIHAVSDVSFVISRGETLGLVGESGSGKTTTGRCLLRLESVDSGEIYFNSDPINAISLNDLRRYRGRLQIVFQNPFETLNPRWTVRDTLVEPLNLHTRLTNQEKNHRISELLDCVRLTPDTLSCYPRELSAGSRQRVAIARALATNPEFIVLDEPTSALSPDKQKEIIDLLMDLQTNLHLSYLYISHDLIAVKHISHTVGVMYLSQLVEYGKKELVFNDPKHPYSQALLASVVLPDPENRRIDRPHEERQFLKGEIPSPIRLPAGCYLTGRCLHETEKCRTMVQELKKLNDGRLVRCWQVSDD